MNWEDTFRGWSQGPSDAEHQRCENTERIICDALNSDRELSKMNLSVFAQGSFKARTNVRQDSDVDICILHANQIFHDAPAGATDTDLGLVDRQLNYATFKNMVEQALVKKFGREQVTRGKKAFDVHANSYRVDADVIPAFTYRWYSEKPGGGYGFNSGIAFIPDDSYTRIINWPKQTYDNGVVKTTQPHVGTNG